MEIPSNSDGYEQPDEYYAPSGPQEYPPPLPGDVGEELISDHSGEQAQAEALEPTEVDGIPLTEEERIMYQAGQNLAAVVGSAMEGDLPVIAWNATRKHDYGVEHVAFLQNERGRFAITVDTGQPAQELEKMTIDQARERATALPPPKRPAGEVRVQSLEPNRATQTLFKVGFNRGVGRDGIDISSWVGDVPDDEPWAQEGVVGDVYEMAYPTDLDDIPPHAVAHLLTTLMSGGDLSVDEAAVESFNQMPASQYKRPTLEDPSTIKVGVNSAPRTRVLLRLFAQELPSALVRDFRQFMEYGGFPEEEET